VEGLGVNAQILFWSVAPNQWDRQLTRMAPAGVRVVRADAMWQSVEPQPPDATGHHYQWDRLDAIAMALAQHGLRWLPTVDFSTSWTSTAGAQQWTSPPLDVASYAAYAAALVRRYGRSGSFWAAHPDLAPRPVDAVEIWNEPNDPIFWAGTTDAAEYARMYAAARAAVHNVDPSIEAIVGGLSEPASDFMNQLYAVLGGAGHVDAVAEHPYGRTADLVLRHVVDLRRTLDAHGDANVPIDVTEFGWPTRGWATWISTLSDGARASELTRVIDTLAGSDCGVERILPHTWVTSAQNPNDYSDWFGLFNPNGTPTLTGAAFVDKLAALARAVPVGHATIPLCARSLALTLKRVSAPAGGRQNVCVRATAQNWLPGPRLTRLTGVTASFQVASRRARAPTTLTTNAAGQATTCYTITPGTRVHMLVTAQHPYFTQVPARSFTASAPAATPKPPKRRRR
jgi:hypothetical protein